MTAPGLQNASRRVTVGCCGADSGVVYMDYIYIYIYMGLKKVEKMFYMEDVSEFTNSPELFG